MTQYQKFNVNEISSHGGSTTYKPKEPISAGIYRGFITTLNWQDNSKKNGKYLKVGITVIYTTQVFPDTRYIKLYLNLNNISDYSVKKGKEQFADLCNALDIENVDYNAEQGIGPHEYERFLGKEVKVRVGVKENSNNGQFENTIEKFYSRADAETSIKENVKTPEVSTKTLESSPGITFAQKTEFNDLNDDIPF